MKKRIAFIVMLLTIASSQITFADSGSVNTASLNVRQKPSVLASVTGSLSKNTKINTLGKEGDFYKISYKGKTGYVYSSYINIVKNSVKSTSVVKSVTPVKAKYIERSGETTAKHLNIRSGAGTTYPVIGTYTLGSKVTISDKINGFYKIMYKGQTSYISELYVKITDGKTVNTNSTSSVTAPVLLSTGTKTVSNAPIDKPQYIANGQQHDVLISGNNLVTYSNTFLGMPYLWGGMTPAKFSSTGKYISGGFDCSGFVQYVYKHFDINLPRITMDQVDEGASVGINNLQNGDLVFFMTNLASPYEISHVGIYIGNNKFIHCSKPGDVIKVSELTGYYKEAFAIGKRIIK